MRYYILFELYHLLMTKNLDNQPIITKNLDNDGLKSIVNDYDLFFIDLWGVVHNGVEVYKNSIEVLNQLNKINKEYVLLTNAPRPSLNVKMFLEKMGIKKEISSKVYSSGEAALEHLLKNKDKCFFHIGPPRDFDLFKSFENKKVNKIKDAEYLLCTGLFDDHDKDLNYYETFLEPHLKKLMICTNPDLIVDRGDSREYCAGTIARLFDQMGGEVEYFGKPYAKIYNQATDITNKKILCIGDNLNTDIRGANLQCYDSLLISNGVHKKEIEVGGTLNVFIKYSVSVDYIQSNLKW
jgi:HAD superfamily hydrolase (TIGR01459 family)